MMNPNTGEILSMVGKKIEYDEDTGKRIWLIILMVRLQQLMKRGQQ